MIGLSPALQSVALDPVTQIILAKFHGVRWSPPELPEGRITIGKPREYGKVKRVALAFLAGAYGAADYPDVAITENVSTESLKQTLWKIRSGWKEPKRGKARRRAAA